MSEAYKRHPRRSVPVVGSPPHDREMRAQGKRTRRRLLDAAMRTFSERGYHATRVDDIVRAARTSHGTFYLYFANKEEVLRALAVECANELGALRHDIGPITPDSVGERELRRFLGRFIATYARHGPVIRAWMEDHVEDREVNRLGVVAFTSIAAGLAAQMAGASATADAATVGALMAMLERFAYYLVSRGIEVDEAIIDALAATVHRGFF